ncbi:MAG TPA: NAD-dependent DNA ligase LigA, partial [Chitinophagaceae bacterium]|nr:NAD-dependent DNA ligase LigA [Chitinophagaceae bacterium]
SDPVLSDAEYDRLFAALKALEASHPEVVEADSPTQRVAGGLTRAFPPVAHRVPMLSLENSYNEQDLTDWDKRARESTGLKDLEYCVEPKFDGAGISLIYEGDTLTRGATRGDGETGEEITVNVRQIRAIPLTAKFSSYGIGQAEIRGEVMINKDIFKKFNEQRAAESLPPLANPRNAASGSLRMVDPREVGKRGLTAILYHLSFFQSLPRKSLHPTPGTHSGVLEMLRALGFRSPAGEMKVVRGIGEVIAFCREAELRRDELPFEIDGMVIKVNDLNLQEQMGMTTHHPRWAMAFKFKPRQGTSKLRRVEFQVGRTGSVTPVAKIDPVPIGGVTVSSVSLFNEDVVREKDLRIGDTVLVERAGDVIPYIVKPMEGLRDGTEKPIVFPTRCPVCGDELVRSPDESAWRCVNASCEAQVVERIIHFVSKDAMDIRSLGETNVKKFYGLGLLRDIPGIYSLDFEKLKSLEGFGPRSLQNLREAINHSRAQPLHRLIYGLGIRYVGETTAKTLAAAVQDIGDLEDWDVERLTSLEDIGPKVAESVHRFFSNRDNLHLLKKIRDAGVNTRNTHHKAAGSGTLQGKTFLFTGTLTGMKRSEAEELVEAHGGKLLGSVSTHLNYLVAGAEAGSKLEKAKKIPSVTILDEEAFGNLIGAHKKGTHGS